MGWAWEFVLLLTCDCALTAVDVTAHMFHHLCAVMEVNQANFMARQEEEEELVFQQCQRQPKQHRGQRQGGDDDATDANNNNGGELAEKSG